MSLYDIKKKLEVLTLFEKSTSAMKLVALSMYNQIKKIIPLAREEYMFNQDTVSSHFDTLQGRRMASIFIGTDRAFCGDFNIKMREKFISVTPNKETSDCIIIGKMLQSKIDEYQKDLPFKKKMGTKFDKISSYVNNFYLYLVENNIDLIEIYHTVSEGFTKRDIKMKLCIINPSLYKIKNDFSLESSTEVTFNEAFTLYIFKSLFSYILQESLLAENSVRFLTMNSALQNAQEAIENQKKLYFKERQQKINSDLGDLVGSLL